MLLFPPSSPCFHLAFPPSLRLSSFILPASLPPSPADLHQAALINTPLFLASHLLNVKTGNQRVTFHTEWKSKVPGCFSASAPPAGRAHTQRTRAEERARHNSVAVKEMRGEHLPPGRFTSPSLTAHTAKQGAFFLIFLNEPLQCDNHLAEHGGVIPRAALPHSGQQPLQDFSKFSDNFKDNSVNFPDGEPDDCHCTLGPQAISCHAAALVASRIDKKKKSLRLWPNIIVNVSSLSKEDTVKAF